jgi:hypothetical protein
VVLAIFATSVMTAMPNNGITGALLRSDTF